MSKFTEHIGGQRCAVRLAEILIRDGIKFEMKWEGGGWFWFSVDEDRKEEFMSSVFEARLAS